MQASERLDFYDRQMRIGIEFPGMRKEATQQWVRFIRPAPGMNFVHYSRVPPADLDGVIREQVDDLGALGQPFSWHVYEHDGPPELKERLLAHGFVANGEPDAVMVLDIQHAPQALLDPPQADLRSVEQGKLLDDLVWVEEQATGASLGWLRERLASHLQIPGALEAFVAYLDGEPASVGWVYFYPGVQFAGLFGGGTVPLYRRRGLYTAVLAARVQAAWRQGCRYVTTGAGPMSRPILEKHGFSVWTSMQAFEWKGRSA